MKGLEEDKITWFSNNSVPFICYTLDLEGCEIAGYSNIGKSKSRCFVRKQITWCSSPTAVKNHECAGFSNRNGSSVLCCKDEEIAGYSNSRDSVRRTTSSLEEDEITWYSNTCYTFQPEHTWKRKKLQNSQTRM